MQLRDQIEIKSNVTVLLKDPDGCVTDRRDSHNVFVDQGRQWLRNLVGMGAAAYLNPNGAGAADQNMTSDAGQSGNADTLAITGKTYKVRFIGVGVGGALQTITPPGPGGFIEETTVNRLEYPVQSAEGTPDEWLKEVLPQDDLSNVQLFPDSFSIRFRALFGATDISFANQIDGFGTAVPISEAGLFHSQAGLLTDPTVGTNGSLGLVAYNIFSPIVKTPNFTLEIAWSLRF